ncbi:unnamed protein product [Ilex paraguariensis]|uniref:Uncharacterized protein n=1 Tax=Ilex paraguariensis TaxID=185542 RepID=A0ABC8SSJ7_9AQUA
MHRIRTDLALESVEEALLRLEELLQELHLSNSSSGKEHLKAACSDLESIRKLKKEAEFLEASFRAKAASLQRESDDDNHSPSSIGKQRQYSGPKDRKSASMKMDGRSRVGSNPRGLWNFLVRHPGGKSEPGISTADGSGDDPFEEATVGMGVAGSESNEIQRFELLRTELIELEKRVQKSTDHSENEEEEIQMTGETASYNNEVESIKLVQVQKKENIIEKSLDKLKGTTTEEIQMTGETASYNNEVESIKLVQVQKKENIIEKSLDKLKGTTTEEIQMTGETASYNNEVESIKLVQVQKKENIIEKSLDKLKGTTTVWMSYPFKGSLELIL